MVQERESTALDTWLDDCAASNIVAQRTFASGLRNDYAAVHAALDTAWSNSPTEGHVNRLKTLKRQMYGRANLDLLRIRLLHPV